MRRASTTIYTFLVAAFVAACCNPPDSIGAVAVALNPQQTNMWCWAASGRMVMGALGTTVTQCDEANRRFGRTDCCNNPTPAACINGGWPEFGKYGYTFSVTADAPLTWDQVKKHIYCRKQPFAFSWHWVGGGGHMMVATGYVTVGSTHYVCVNNPWPPNTGDQYCHTYDEYVSGTDHTHWNDYYNFAKQ